MKINSNRIMANAAVAFFTVFTALTFAQINTPSLLAASLYGAVIQAGLAAAKDYKDQSEGSTKKGTAKFLVI